MLKPPPYETFALFNLVRHDPKQALFLIRSGAAGPVAQFLSNGDDATKGAAAALCRAMVSCRDAADTVARSATPALVLLAGKGLGQSVGHPPPFYTIHPLSPQKNKPTVVVYTRRSPPNR